jgi:SAM-dependent methyltransferase
MEAYQYPHYYEIALAPDNPGRELDFFEAAIKKFSKARVHRVFELGAGTAPYLEEWHKRGYAYCGLDLSAAMVEFGRDKARRCGIDARFVLGDMRDLDRGLGRFDLVYVLLGSLYVRSNQEFLDHLERVADLLAPGGLYLLDSFVWFRIFHDYQRSWSRRKNGIHVHTRYRAELLDPIAQTYNETLTFTVNDHGTEVVIRGQVPAKVFFPQEFLCLVELSGRFEFSGWYNDFSFAAPLTPEGRHLTILRKRQAPPGGRRPSPLPRSRARR